MNGTRPLILDSLVADPALARQLPAHLARRYHALPIAQHQGRITVAMADPDDPAALHAITSALGAPARQGTDPSGVFVVRSEQATIDALVAEIWEDPAENRPAILVWPGISPRSDEVLAYGQALGRLLDVEPVARILAAAPLEGLVEAGGGQEVLAVLGDDSRAQIWRPLERLPVSLLLVRRPTWPLRKLLLVIQGRVEDGAALAWSVRLARPAGAEVIILAVVPPVPAMYAGLDGMGHDLPAIIHSETALGRSLRQAARWLVNWEVAGTVRLRQGVPELEVLQEAGDGPYDLVAAGIDRQGNPLERLATGLASGLLGRLEVPLLLARPKPMAPAAA